MNKNLEYQIAVMIAKELEFKLYEASEHTFEYDYDDCDPEISRAQDIYLRLSKKIINKVKKHNG